MSSEHSDIDAPALEPIGEVTESVQLEFTARCSSHVAPFLLKGNWEFQRGLVTRSSKWGLVWRGDYTIADFTSPQLINRIVCWEGSDGQLLTEIAVGQRIAPLPATSPAVPSDRTT